MLISFKNLKSQNLDLQGACRPSALDEGGLGLLFRKWKQWFRKKSPLQSHFLKSINFFQYDIKNFLETRVFQIFVVCFAVIFFSLALLSRWAVTEIYPTHTARFLVSDSFSEFLFSLKPLFYFVLWVSFLFSKIGDWLPMTGARGFFALNGLLILALVYLCVKQKTNRWSAVLSVLFLGVSSVFLERGFRIRSDLLLSSLSLFIYWIVLQWLDQKNSTGSRFRLLAHKRKFYSLLVLFSLLLLISPKSLYWFLFMPFLLSHDLKGQFWPRQELLKGVLFITLSFIVLSFLMKDIFFARAIKEAVLYYFLNIKNIFHLLFEWGWIKTMSEGSHLFMFIEKNPLITLIIGVKLLFVIYRFFSTPAKKQALLDTGFLILLSVFFFHPQQKMFFLCALSPFFVILFFTDPQWLLLQKKYYSQNFKMYFLAGAFLYSTFEVSRFGFKVYHKKNNFSQKKTIQLLNNFYEKTPKELKIFDPNCLLYKRKTTCRYILYRGEIQLSKEFKSYFKEQNFDVILSSRMLDIFRLEGLRFSISGEETPLLVEKTQPPKKSTANQKDFFEIFSYLKPNQSLIFNQKDTTSHWPNKSSQLMKTTSSTKTTKPFVFFLKTKAQSFEHKAQVSVQYIQIQNHIFYKALVFEPQALGLLPHLVKKTDPLKSFSLSALGVKKESLVKKGCLFKKKGGEACLTKKRESKKEVSGERLVQTLLSVLDKKHLTTYKQWFYFYLDLSGRPLSSSLENAVLSKNFNTSKNLLHQKTIQKATRDAGQFEPSDPLACSQKFSEAGNELYEPSDPFDFQKIPTPSSTEEGGEQKKARAFLKSFDHAMSSSNRGQVLCPGRPYSLLDFQSGFIPFRQNSLALFYLPFPWQLPPDLLLRDQFRYDLY